MKSLFLLAAASAAIAGAAITSVAWAHEFKGGDVTVGHPWSRPAAAGSNGVGFMALTNTGATPVTFVSVNSPGSAGAMVHRTQAVGGVYSMTPATNLQIKAGETVTFAPGGYHVMFTGLKAPLAPGGRLPATLTFKRGATKIVLPVTFNVPAAAPSSSGHAH